MSLQKVFARMEERLDAEAEDYGDGVQPGAASQSSNGRATS